MEILPEKSEMMAFSGKGPVRCNIIVNNIYENFKYISCECPMKWKRFQQITAKFTLILGILNNTFEPYLVHKSSKVSM